MLNNFGSCRMKFCSGLIINVVFGHRDSYINFFVMPIKSKSEVALSYPVLGKFILVFESRE